jgi:hypothetical protein
MAASDAIDATNPRAGSKLSRKIIITLAVGLLVFILTYEFGVSDQARLLLGLGTSIYVSGLAFVIQFLVDVENRIERVEVATRRVERRHDQHDRQTEQMIRDEFEKINEATKLFGAVEASALNSDAVTQLVQNSTRVVRSTGSLVSDFAQGEIARLSTYLRDLGQGADVTYEGEDRDWLLGLTRVAKTSIDATSLTTVDAGGRSFVDGGLWTSGFGLQYLEEQRRAIEAGVEVRRVFIFDRPELQNDRDVVRILKEHKDIGVKVRALAPDRIPGTRRAMLFDFVVIDGVLSYQVTPATRVEDSNRPVIATTTLVTDPDRVRERIGRYRDLWNSGVDFDPDAGPAVTE